MKYLSQLSKREISGKTCLLRAGLNIGDPKQHSSRLETTLPTIKFLIKNGCQVIIISHRGRPKNNKEAKYSLKPIIEVLKNKLGSKYPIDWLENLRLDPREEKNSSQFAKELSQKGDFYVNESFESCHRRHASLVAITKYLPSYAGLQLEREIKILSQIKEHPIQPLVIIIGGIKIKDKIQALKNLLPKAKKVLIGSAYVKLRHPLLKNKKVIMPIDWLGTTELIKDIGPKTIKIFSDNIKSAKSIIWNGPMGNINLPQYQAGTKAIAQAIAKSGSFSVVGGGDTDQFLNKIGLDKKIKFISTGGGAMLMFLSGKKLPALEALENNRFNL